MNSLRRFSLLIALFFVCAVSAFAQLSISGNVVDAYSGKGVSGVNIKVKGSNAGAFSDRSGNFKLMLPNANTATILLNYIGYKQQEIKVDASNAASVAVRLQEDVLKTSEVVVTGLASTIKKANSPTSIGTISEKELVPAPASTVDQAFAGKFAGVSIRQNTGAPGGGMSVTLRGASTLLGGSQPLYVVDGVIVSNTTFSGGQNLITSAGSGGATGGASQEQSVNRIADLNPNDIEDVQVLKGPSAAAAYGSQAAAGVIVITTKQGRAGKTQVTVNQQTGFNEIARKLGLRKFTTRQEVIDWAANFGASSDFVKVWDNAVKNGNTYFDHEDLLYGQKGLISETDVTVRGGNENTQFNMGGTYRKEDGIMKNTGFERLAARLAVNHSFNDRLSAKVNFSYTRTKSERGFTGNSNNDNVSVPYIVSVMPTFFDGRKQADGTYPDLLGQNPASAYEVVDRAKNTEYVNHFRAATNLNWTILKTEDQSLDFIVRGGADYISQRNFIYDPADMLHQRVKTNPGIYGVSDAQNLNSNLYLTLAHRLEISDGISFTSQGGIQFENQGSNSVVNTSQGFSNTLENLSGAAVQQSIQTVSNRYTQGIYLQEDVDISGKFFISAGVRADRSSANGNADKFYLFPKVAASMQFSQFDFWSGMKDILPQFKLRVAYGEAGTPVNSIAAKYTLLSSANNNLGALGSGLAVNSRIGNPDIRPERAKELEFGIDFTLGDGFASVELSYYTKNIVDLILSRALVPSSGYSSVFQNSGSMTNNGFEASVNFSAVRTELIEWRPRVNFFTNTTKITELGAGVIPYNSGGFGATYGANYVRQGLSATAIIGRENFTSGVFNGTVAGNSAPDFQVGFANTLRVQNFELYFLIDWRQGGNAVFLTQNLYESVGLWKDTAVTTLNTNILGLREKRPYSPYINSSKAGDANAGFVKLREASLTYTFPKEILNGFLDGVEFIRLGLTGRNLLIITNYNGYDPEVSNFGNIVTAAGQDVAPFPSSRSYYLSVSVGF